MRILFVVRNISYGGACKQLRMTADALAQRGHEVAAYSYNDDVTLQRFEHATYIPERNVPKNKLGEYLKAIPHIRKTIKSYRPDIVISWRANAGCFTTVACIGLKVKHVFSERTDPYTETNLFLKIATKICDHADAGVFQTEGARDFYRRLSKTNSTVIPNPIESSLDNEIIPYNQRCNEIVWVGRMVMTQKRMDVMLNAFKQVLPSFPTLKLIMYSDGPDMQEAKSLCHNLGMDANVIWPGSISNVPNTIKTAKALVLSSDYEGIPNVIMEAMSVGVPVVSTDVSPGGARVLLDNGRIGLISPTGDSKQLGNNIVRLLNDELLAEEFVSGGLDYIKTFNPSNIFDKWEGFLEKIHGEERNYC